VNRLWARPVPSRKLNVRASVLSGEERDRLYVAQPKVMPAFAEYATKTTRKIPVVALERRKSG